MVQIIRISGDCNQNCVFCCQENRREIFRKTGQSNFKLYCKQIEVAKKRVILSGCETTIYPRIFSLIKLAKNRSLDIELQSNGITLSYEKWAKKFVDSGVTEFNINFPSHIEQTSDAITRTKYSHKKRMQAIKNLLKIKANVRLTYVITKLNYKELPSFSDFINKKFAGLTVIYTFVQNAGSVKKANYLIPKYSNLKIYLLTALNNCSNNKFLTDGIPFCILDLHKNKAIDYVKNKNKEKFFPINTEIIPSCKKCIDENICRGIPKYYLDIFGTDEFKNMISKN